MIMSNRSTRRCRRAARFRQRGAPREFLQPINSDSLNESIGEAIALNRTPVVELDGACAKNGGSLLKIFNFRQHRSRTLIRWV
jgi:hypothetical protein